MPADPLATSQSLSGRHYGNTAIAFHWLMFSLVLIVGILGLLHDVWPRSTQSTWINVRALLGVLLWVMLIARFI